MNLAGGMGRSAIIDIGSNSIRLVIYDGPRRSPFTLFNEKVMAGLGAGLSTDMRLSDESVARGLEALRRFARLSADLEVEKLHCVATAAVREAANGPEFIARVETECGLSIRLLSGQEEAMAAAHGVLSAIPEAEGIVGDLGGGSLELARLRGGEIVQAVSLPLGVLRLAAIRGKKNRNLADLLRQQLSAAGWGDLDTGLPFYMVGGSWRALAKLDMTLTGNILPVLHHHVISPERLGELARTVAATGKPELRRLGGISSGRAATLDDATALLQGIGDTFGSSCFIVSAFGLREGLLYQDLAPAERQADPLLCAARAEGEAQGRFAGHGSQIKRMIAPLFADDPWPLRRICEAACHLADVGWRANPEFRAERGLEIGLHSNWVGIDAPGRALLAQALYSHFGGGTTIAPDLEKLAGPDLLKLATGWGLAIRLVQRMSGGMSKGLDGSYLERRDGALVLRVSRENAWLLGEAVKRRLKGLAACLDRQSEIEIYDA